MTALLIGYARCSTDEQDLTVQREGLAALGVTPERIYVDHGLTGCNRERPGLREALAACRDGDTLVVTKLDRLARSLPGCPGDRRRADHPAGPAQPRRVRVRPDRPGRPTAVQRAGHGRRVRGRPHPAAHQGGHENRQGQRSATRQATQAQPSPGSASGRCCSSPGNTTPPRSATCSASHGRPSTGRSDARQPGNAPNGQIDQSSRPPAATTTPAVPRSRSRPTFPLLTGLPEG